VPFWNGLLLCQLAGLEVELVPFLALAKAAFPARISNPFILVETVDVVGSRNNVVHKVRYKPKERLVSGVDVCLAFDMTRRNGSRQVNKTVPNPGWFSPNSEPYEFRGAFITFADAERLAQEIGKDYGPIRRALAQHMAFTALPHQPGTTLNDWLRSAA